MGSSKSSSKSGAGFWIGAGMIVVASAALAALAWPLAMSAAHAESRRLLAAGERAWGSERVADLELAQWLDRGNVEVAVKLAGAQLAAGQDVAAVQTLSRAGQGIMAARLRLEAGLELGDAEAVEAAAGRLAAVSAVPDDVVLATLAELAVGRSAAAQALMPRISSPEAAQGVIAAQTSKLALARELYARGLKKSSDHLLMKLPSSFSRDVLLAQIGYDQGGTRGLAAAERYGTAATKFAPADVAARELLVAILRAEAKTATAEAQQRLVDSLRIGRP